MKKIEYKGLIFKTNVNTDTNKKIVSVTFIHNECIFKKVEGNSFYQIVKKFKGIIDGTIYDNNLKCLKYKQDDDTYTYIVSDGNYYKIGKSKNVKQRISSLKSANPNIGYLKSSLYVPEKYLHDLFNSKNYKLEWFNLSKNDLDIVFSLMSADSKEQALMLMRMIGDKFNKEITFKNKQRALGDNKVYKLKFGKFKGKNVYKMKVKEEFNYLLWLYKNVDVDAMLLKAIQEVFNVNQLHLG